MEISVSSLWYIKASEFVVISYLHHAFSFRYNQSRKDFCFFWAQFFAVSQVSPFIPAATSAHRGPGRWSGRCEAEALDWEKKAESAQSAPGRWQRQR